MHVTKCCIYLNISCWIWIVSNETNTEVHMYIWRIYSSRCSHISVQVGTEDMDWNLHWFIYKCNNSHMLLEQRMRSTIDTFDTLLCIALQLYEKLSLWDQDVWNVISLFASHLTPVSINWYLHWLWSSQTVGETTECHSCS